MSPAAAASRTKTLPQSVYHCLHNSIEFVVFLPALRGNLGVPCGLVKRASPVSGLSCTLRRPQLFLTSRTKIKKDLSTASAAKTMCLIVPFMQAIEISTFPRLCLESNPKDDRTPLLNVMSLRTVTSPLFAAGLSDPRSLLPVTDATVVLDKSHPRVPCQLPRIEHLLFCITSYFVYFKICPVSFLAVGDRTLPFRSYSRNAGLPGMSSTPSAFPLTDDLIFKYGILRGQSVIIILVYWCMSRSVPFSLTPMLFPVDASRGATALAFELALLLRCHDPTPNATSTPQLEHLLFCITSRFVYFMRHPACLSVTRHFFSVDRSN